MNAVLIVASLMLPAQTALDEEPASPQAQKRKWEALYNSEAASYTISLDGDSEKTLTMRPQPVLLWNNPVRGGDTNGAVFVWTYNGRTELVGTIFSHLAGDNSDQKLIAHSFHSLSLQPLKAERNESRAWAMDVPGIEPQPIPDAPAPAKTAALRLTQLRNLARDFSATTTLEGVEQDLRLLPQPLHRYENSSEDVLDGALFTFVTGTDPEMMLVIEARRAEDDFVWHFGAGKFTDLALKLRHKDAILWTYTPGLEENTQKPYLSRRTEMRNRILP